MQNLPEESIFTDDDEVAVLANGSVINAKYAATIIDGVVVEPGETFSFNQVVGPRTLQTGFVAGLSLSGASLIPDVGGGICRTATALHWAVQEAGMEILEHHNHTQKVPYADEGGDAAVWWDMLDYKFVNDGDDPIRILAQGQGDQVWVAILQEPN